MQGAMRIKDAATYLGLSPSSIYRLEAAGQLNVLRLGRRCLILKTDADALLQSALNGNQRQPIRSKKPTAQPSIFE